MRRPPTSRVPTFQPAPTARRTAAAPAEPLDDLQPVGVLGSSRGQAGASRSLHALLWTLLVGAVVLGLISLLSLSTRRPVAAAAPSPASKTPEAPPGGCAELVVNAWLAGDTSTLKSLVSTDLPRLPEGKRAAARTYTLQAKAVTAPAQTWAYVVGAEVLTIDKDGRRSPAGIQFFSVALTQNIAADTPLVGACGGWTAPSLPANVAGLSAATQVKLAYDRTLSTTGHPIADTLNPFFTALLVGDGQVERYLAPGTTVAAVTPAPYSKVRLERLAAVKADADLSTGQSLPVDGTRVHLLATVSATAGAEPGEWSLNYPLTMTVRGGRWEITSVDPAPVMAPADPDRTTGPAGRTPRPTPSTTASATSAPRPSTKE